MSLRNPRCNDKDKKLSLYYLAPMWFLPNLCLANMQISSLVSMKRHVAVCGLMQ